MSGGSDAARSKASRPTIRTATIEAVSLRVTTLSSQSKARAQLYTDGRAKERCAEPGPTV
ncbi:hypothetical protein PARPLA_02178 [Rhodobacteraceae bacterium THAF1]|nr:hypothetical protein FIU81_04295 [Palleronia sp. THAF1]VDC25724.1 hypothetical protein PARPLA_02178 [Rhodobacteraceae bacterium THAF1]